MNIYEKLQAVQAELHAPKGQFNSFGKYNYRSCEDILEAVKPILTKHGATITLSDEITTVGTRYYVIAYARFYATDADAQPIVVTAYAQESETKKGMDASQLTGTASSYARKYALNGLLLIDDTKDADTNERHNETKAKAEKVNGRAVEVDEPAYPSRNEMEKAVADVYTDENPETEKMLKWAGVEGIDDMTNAQLMTVYNKVVKR